jgi:GNAT superfamily N-acetyltransferase
MGKARQKAGIAGGDFAGNYEVTCRQCACLCRRIRLKNPTCDQIRSLEQQKYGMSCHACCHGVVLKGEDTVTEPRIALADDAGRLSEIAERTFRETFAHSCSVEDMHQHCAAEYSEAIQRQEILDPQLVTLVCADDGQLMGFTQLRWCQAPDGCSDADAMEVQRLYVDPKWHGRGVAQRLMGAAIDVAERQGPRQIWLGVWEHNPRALAFYAKYGFVEAGEHIFKVGEDLQRDLIVLRQAG